MCCFPRPRVWKPFFVWCLVVPCWDASKFRGERGATTVARPHACCRPRFARPAASQVLDVEAAVEDYIPSFAREWSVVESPPSEGTEASEIEYNSFLTGKTSTLKCKTSQVGISAAPRRTPPHLLHLLQAPRVDLVAAGNRAVDVGVRGSFEPNPNPTAFRIPPPPCPCARRPAIADVGSLCPGCVGLLRLPTHGLVCCGNARVWCHITGGVWPSILFWLVFCLRPAPLSPTPNDDGDSSPILSHPCSHGCCVAPQTTAACSLNLFAGPRAASLSNFVDTTTPAKTKMLVKHLMAESSGIGYDQWSVSAPADHFVGCLLLLGHCTVIAQSQHSHSTVNDPPSGILSRLRLTFCWLSSTACTVESAESRVEQLQRQSRFSMMGINIGLGQWSLLLKIASISFNHGYMVSPCSAVGAMRLSFCCFFPNRVVL